MATGSGTGTPASSSADTITTLRNQVERLLQDASNTKWSESDLDEAIRQALEHFTARNPHRAVSSLTLSADGREIDISSLSNVIHVTRVWWEYDSSDPDHPPNWREFEEWPSDTVYINDGDEPQSGDVVRVYYTQPHTINGLDGEATTTINTAHIDLLARGAAAYAALMRAQELSEKLNVDGFVTRRLVEWGQARLEEFEARLQLIAKRNALAHTDTIATLPPLDRWDQAHHDWS